MLKNLFWASVIFGGLGQFNVKAASFADAVVDYVPGVLPAASRSFTNATAALGEPSRVTPGTYGGPVDPFNPAYLNTQLVSMGAGGSLTVQFNTPIVNDPAHPFGLDFLVFGSAGFTITNGNYSGGGITDGTLLGPSTGTTRVSVSDDNVTYYPLNSVLAPVFDGNYPTDGGGDFSRPVNPALTAAEFAGKDIAAIQASYAGSGGGAGYDLAWAQDSQGHPVNLSQVRYVRLEVLGGHSEVDGLGLVNPVPEPSAACLAGLGLGRLAWRWRAGYRRATRPPLHLFN
jgi:hypothetical protein